LTAARFDELLPEFFSDVRNVYFDDVGETIVVFIEDMVIDHTPRNQFASVQCEKFQQCVFPCSEYNLLVPVENGLATGIDPDGSDFDDVRRVSGTSTDQCANASQQLSKAAWLHHIVVCPRVQTVDSISYRVACSEK
jgi:hypothetical protein